MGERPVPGRDKDPLPRRRHSVGRRTTAALIAITFGTAACLAGLVTHWQIVARQDPPMWQLGGFRSLDPADARMMSNAFLMLAGGGALVCGGLGLAILRVAMGGSRNGPLAVILGVLAVVILGVMCLFTFSY